jgi:uncharacterized protein (DUF4415 family)
VDDSVTPLETYLSSLREADQRTQAVNVSLANLVAPARLAADALARIGDAQSAQVRATLPATAEASAVGPVPDIPLERMPTQRMQGAADSTLSSQSFAAALAANTSALAANTAALLKQGGAAGGRGAQPTLAPPTPAGGGLGGFDKIAGSLDNWGQKISAFSGGIQSAFGGATSSIFGFVSAIDPSAVATFNGSMQMAAGEVGKVFVPYILQASFALQDLSKWFGGLDESTKVWIGRAGMAAAVLGTLSVGARALGPAFTLAAGGVRVFSTAMSFLFASPVGLAITATAALAAGIVTLTGSWERLGKAVSGTAGALGAGAQGMAAALSLPGMAGQRPLVQIGDLPQEFQKETEKLRMSGDIAGVRQVTDTHVERISREIAAAQASQTAETLRMQAARPQVKILVDAAVKEANKSYDFYLRDYEDETGKKGAKLLPRESVQAVLFSRETNEIRERLAKQVQEQFKFSAPPEILAGIRATASGPFVDRVTPPANMMVGPGSTPAMTATINRLTVEQDRLLTFARQIGATSGAQGSQHLQDVKFPVQARYTDPLSFRDSVQLQALNVGDLEAQNRAREAEQLLQRLGEGNELLKEVRDGINEMLKIPFLFGGG